jgi:hypothetical protein
MIGAHNWPGDFLHRNASRCSDLQSQSGSQSKLTTWSRMQVYNGIYLVTSTDIDHSVEVPEASLLDYSRFGVVFKMAVVDLVKVSMVWASRLTGIRIQLRPSLQNRRASSSVKKYSRNYCQASRLSRTYFVKEELILLVPKSRLQLRPQLELMTCVSTTNQPKVKC